MPREVGGQPSSCPCRASPVTAQRLCVPGLVQRAPRRVRARSAAAALQQAQHRARHRLGQADHRLGDRRIVRSWPAMQALSADGVAPTSSLSTCSQRSRRAAPPRGHRAGSATASTARWAASRRSGSSASSSCAWLDASAWSARALGHVGQLDSGPRARRAALALQRKPGRRRAHAPRRRARCRNPRDRGARPSASARIAWPLTNSTLELLLQLNKRWRNALRAAWVRCRPQQASPDERAVGPSSASQASSVASRRERHRGACGPDAGVVSQLRRMENAARQSDAIQWRLPRRHAHASGAGRSSLRAEAPPAHDESAGVAECRSDSPPVHRSGCASHPSAPP